jgi:hypothetical protein
MSGALYSIGRVCDALAGIRSFIYADMTNVANYGPGFLPPAPNTPPSFTDMDQLYSIVTDRYSGEASRESAADQGGDYARHQVRIFIPRSQSQVDTLLQRWRNRLLCVIGIDRYGSQHILYDAIASWRHSTGTRPGTRHGYEITFTATSHYILPAMAGSGDITTAPPVGGSGGSPGSGECCITIAPLSIAYTPSPTGNAMNLNEMVTTPTGAVYFIDSTGRSILLNYPAPKYYTVDLGETEVDEITLPMSFPLPDETDYPDPTYDTYGEMSIRIWCKVGSRWLQYGHPEGFTIDADTHKAHFPAGYISGTVEFYSYQGYPSTPL